MQNQRKHKALCVQARATVSKFELIHSNTSSERVEYIIKEKLVKQLANCIMNDQRFFSERWLENKDMKEYDIRCYVLTADDLDALVASIQRDVMSYRTPVFGGISEVPID